MIGKESWVEDIYAMVREESVTRTSGNSWPVSQNGDFSSGGQSWASAQEQSSLGVSTMILSGGMIKVKYLWVASREGLKGRFVRS